MPTHPGGPPSKHVPFSKRAIKQNPLLVSRDAAKEKRRELFTRRVQKDREERRWQTRSDEILRLDYLSRQRKWEAAKARQAPRMESPWDDEDADVPMFSSQLDASQHPMPTASSVGGDAQDEVEAVLRQEEGELEALLALMEDEQVDQPQPVHASSHYGSDEDDFDGLFMDYIGAEERVPPRHNNQSHERDSEAMDMSGG